MKIFVEKLEPLLLQKAYGFFFCSGSEAFLVNDISDNIVAAAKKHGFTEISRYYADQHFSWEKVYETLLTPSLFCPKIAVIIQLTHWKLDEKAKEMLLNISEKNSTDLLVIIKGPKLEKATSNTKWFQQLTEKNIWIDIPAISAFKLPEWIQSRAYSFSLKLNREQAQQLAALTENNLFAAKQALEKIALLQQPISTKLIQEVVENNAEYDIFKLIDACLSSDATRSFTIFNTLKNSSAEPVMMIGAWARELRLLCDLFHAMTENIPLKTAAQRVGIWESRLPLIQRFIQRCSQKECEKYLAKLAELDAIAKGAIPGNIWHELFMFCMQMTQSKSN